MAVTPLFATSMTAIAKELRMGVTYGQSGSEDVTAIIDRAVQEARVFIYQALGIASVTTILSTPYVDNPATEAEITRLQGVNAEIITVRYMIAKSYPVYYINKLEEATASYASDITTRQASPNQMEKVLDILAKAMQDALDMLKGRASSLASEFECTAINNNDTYDFAADLEGI